MAKAIIIIPDRSPLKTKDEGLMLIIPPTLELRNPFPDDWRTNLTELLAELYTLQSGEDSEGTIEITGGQGLDATVTITPDSTASFDLDVSAQLIA